MDIVTLAAAKKYTDDKLISSGNGGAVVDPTLSLSGAAADAKATGDKIKELNTKFDNIELPDVPTKVSELENDKNYVTTDIIGDLSLLETVNRGSLVDAINEINAKNLVAVSMKSVSVETDEDGNNVVVVGGVTV